MKVLSKFRLSGKEFSNNVGVAKMDNSEVFRKNIT